MAGQPYNHSTVSHLKPRLDATGRKNDWNLEQVLAWYYERTGLLAQMQSIRMPTLNVVPSEQVSGWNGGVALPRVGVRVKYPIDPRRWPPACVAMLHRACSAAQPSTSPSTL